MGSGELGLGEAREKLEHAAEAVLGAGDRRVPLVVRDAAEHHGDSLGARRGRERDADDILTFGSRTLWNGLLQQGLVDELHLMMGPAAICSGIPIFGDPAKLTLLGTRRFEGSENVLLRYAIASAP